MITALPERCSLAWWDELTTAQRRYWHTSVQRLFRNAEQIRLLRAEGLPLVNIHAQSGEEVSQRLSNGSTVADQVLFPLDLADLLEQDAQAS